MTNRQQLRKINKAKRVRRGINRLGDALLGLGFCIIIMCSGESDLGLWTLFGIGLAGCATKGVGCLIVNFIEYLNEEYPLVYRPKDEGDDLWYELYIHREYEVVER